MMLELKNVYKTYTQGKMDVPVLKNISLSVEEGEYVAVMGPSGSGKTTLMNIIGCLDSPTSGEYFLDGKDIAQIGDSKMSEVRLHSIGFVFQSFYLLSRQSALENVALPLLYAGVRRRERMAIAQKALERVGLGDRTNFKPTQLSGGQCQRVAIARAMVNNPKILLADEPTGALDTKSGEQIMEIFQALHQEGVTIVMITHEPEIAAHAQRTLHIRDGRLIDAQGNFLSPEEVDETDAAPSMPADVIPAENFFSTLANPVPTPKAAYEEQEIEETAAPEENSLSQPADTDLFPLSEPPKFEYDEYSGESSGPSNDEEAFALDEEVSAPEESGLSQPVDTDSFPLSEPPKFEYDEYGGESSEPSNDEEAFALDEEIAAPEESSLPQPADTDLLPLSEPPKFEYDEYGGESSGPSNDEEAFALDEEIAALLDGETAQWDSASAFIESAGGTQEASSDEMLSKQMGFEGFQISEPNVPAPTEVSPTPAEKKEQKKQAAEEEAPEQLLFFDVWDAKPQKDADSAESDVSEHTPD